MNQKFTLSTLCLFISLTIGISKNSLLVNNPEWGIWGDIYQGTIEEATFEIQPKGVYMEVGMILTLSARETFWGAGDTLEMVLDFTLPEDAIIHDSWLWIDDDIIQADVRDIWSASAIYSDIVNWNRDPSLLYQKSDGGYQIRIFPLDGADVRKIKITYLSPVKWTHETASISIPTEILQTSYIPLSEFKIITVPNSEFENPRITQNPNVPWDHSTDPFFGDILVMDLEGEHINKPLTFTTDAPLNDGVFFSQTTSNGENFYQMAYVPDFQLNDAPSQKLNFVIERLSWMSNYEVSDIISEIKTQILQNLTAKDSFNLMFLQEGLETYSLDSGWTPADSLSVENAFANLPAIPDKSEINFLIQEGLYFIQQNGNDGELVVFGSSDIFQFINWANDEINEIMSQLNGELIPIHIFDYQTYLESDFWLDPWFDDNPPSNDYLYTNLSRLTGGQYYPSLKGNCSLWESIDNFFIEKLSAEVPFDLEISPSNGFSYQDFTVKYLGQSKYINQPIVQVGKYFGDLPVTIELAALINGNVEFDIVDLEPSQILEADTLMREMWFGHHIWDLSSGNPNNAVVEDVIAMSIEERVLSPFTAFLALEVNLGGQICFGCWEIGDGVIVISTEEVEEEIEVEAYPNPFTDYVVFDFKNISAKSNLNGEIKIFDSLGKEIDSVIFQNQPSVTWTVKNQNLPDGQYYAVVNIGDKILKKKLIHIRN